MADNYLERKYEEYQAQKATGKKSSGRSTLAGAKPGYMQVRFPRRRVFVTGGAGGI